MADNAEDVVIGLTDNVTAPAAAVTGALGAVEEAATRAQATVGATQAPNISAAPIEAAAASFRSLAEASAGIESAAAKLRELQSAAELLQGAESVDVAQFRALTAAIEQQKAAVNSAAQAYVKMGGSATQAAKAAKGAGGAAGGAKVDMGALAGVLSQAGGSFGQAGSQAVGFISKIMKLGPEAAIAAVALIALAAALAIVTAIVAKGISASDDLRNEYLKLKGAAGGSASAAHELQAAITAVSGASALSREKVTDYATQLSAAGLKGAELQRALEAMAIAGSAGGDSVAAAFLKSAQAAKAAGQSVDKLSADMKAKLGGVAAAQALGLGAQLAKLHENIAALFSGANIEPFLKGLHSILALFDQNSAGAKSLRDTISGMVNSAIGGMLRTATAAVKMYTAVKSNHAAWMALKITAITVAVAFGVVLAVVGLLIAAFVIMAVIIALPFLLVIGILVAMYEAFVAAYDAIAGINWGAVGDAIVDGISSAVAWLVGLPGQFAEIGTNMIMSLVGGIANAAGAVISAITDVVGGGIAAAKAVLLSGSPSKVFTDIGIGTGEGFQIGVDKTAPDVQSSMKSMVEPPDVAPGKKKGGAGGGPSFSFTNCTFGGDLTEDKLEAWLVGIAHRNALDAEAA